MNYTKWNHIKFIIVIIHQKKKLRKKLLFENIASFSSFEVWIAID